MSDDSLLVRDLGEHGLLAKLQRFCPADIVGDDGAILATSPDKSIVVTTDVLVDGVHFSDRTTKAFDVGWRAAAANLSDLAAMGANPLGITVGLAVPGDRSVSWVESVYQGMSACLEAYQTPVVGGDICRAPVTSLAITALGEVIPSRAIRRTVARPGDLIMVTGCHGLSRGGLELLLAPDQGKGLESAEREQLIAAHQRPQPRLDVLPYLAPITQQIAIAGMDSSDGLADAIRQICRASGVGAVIDYQSLAIFSGLIKLVGTKTAIGWVLHGGEDYELVLCLPPEFAAGLIANLGGNAAIIGKIVKDSAIKLVNTDDLVSEETLNIGKGFQHF